MKKIKLLMISTDRKIFEEGSDVRARMVKYGNMFSEMHIIVFTKHKFQAPSSKSQTNFKFQISNNVWAYSTNSFSKLSYIFDAIRLGKSVIENCPDFALQNRGSRPKRREKLKIENSLITAQDPFECGLVGRRLARKFKIPLELQIHTDIGSQHFTSLRMGWRLTCLNFIRLWLAKFLLPKADNIRVVSTRIKNFLQSRLKIAENKIEIRPIKIDEEKFRGAIISPENDLRKKYPQFDFIALAAGRLEPEKNFDLMIEAWRAVVKKFPRAGLIIVGSGSLINVLKLQVTSYRLQDNVIFESWQSNLISHYKTADIFLNTSFYEGYGMAMAEARAAGLPVISTDVGAARELGCEIVDWNVTDITGQIINKISEKHL